MRDSIRDTLRDNGAAHFWLLNNGVTIISSYPLRPIDSTRLNIEDPQVVNGLQTSREIFKYFQSHNHSLAPDKRLVFVRVLKVDDETIRNDIVRATNSQNSMKASALRGTDHIHRQIEDLFKQYGFYYDRRPGFYRDQGVAIQKIVGFTELVQASICLLLQRPDDARARPGDYLKGGKRGDAKYASIFGMDQGGNAVQPLGFYLKAVTIIRKVDDFLESKGVEPGDQRNIKFYLAYYLCCTMTESLHPSAHALLKIDSSQIDPHL